VGSVKKLKRRYLFLITSAVKIGFAVAECWQKSGQRHAECLSSYVLPAYRHQPIERRLNQRLQQAVNHAMSHDKD
jgi:ribosomal protein S18 acetylase RimI-like enzyme